MGFGGKYGTNKLHIASQTLNVRTFPRPSAPQHLRRGDPWIPLSTSFYARNERIFVTDHFFLLPAHVF